MIGVVCCFCVVCCRRFIVLGFRFHRCCRFGRFFSFSLGFCNCCFGFRLCLNSGGFGGSLLLERRDASLQTFNFLVDHRRLSIVPGQFFSVFEVINGGLKIFNGSSTGKNIRFVNENQSIYIVDAVVCKGAQFFV